MERYRKPLSVFALALALLFALQLAAGMRSPHPAAAAPETCTTLTSPTEIPSPSLIHFDDLANATVIGNYYQPTYGVTFEDSPTNKAIIYGNEPAEAHSPPNVASNSAVYPNTSNDVPMYIWFDSPKSYVGFYIGNGETQGPQVEMIARDLSGNIICRVYYYPVPEPHTYFLGVHDSTGSIYTVTFDYGDTALSESMDDLYFYPGPNAGPTPSPTPTRTPAPTRTPVPTWTPIPSPTPTPGPTATPTLIIPVIPYYPPLVPVIPPLVFAYDLSIHGIEITQGIQCFDTSQGLAACANNSLPVVAKKDSAARTYLKITGIFSTMNNVPVRLHIRANNVWYQANASGRATGAIDQTTTDSADVYFNVNFTNDVNVDFYAMVDPDNEYSETNESNNRYPASGYITLNFRRRDALKIVGQRLRYHPSGYSGSQYAGGWAVNGGAADWFEQLLPIRNNGIDYSVKSGYLDWTTSLGSGDGQHSLIQTLNLYWILENAFGWLFTGDFTGADHVYGWAPNAGYSGGHADMPVYPHAGGLGVVGIGSDGPGTDTDNPGRGALIFGHELVHDYDVYHTNTADSCGSADGASDFPYVSSNIQEVGFNPFTGKIYTPPTTHDLMSYCPSGGSRQGWISPFTWNKMFYINPGLAVYQRSERGTIYNVLTPTGANESLVVNATIYNPDYNPPIPGELGDLYKINTGASYLPPPGDYAVALYTLDNQIVYSQTFAVNFQSEYQNGSHSHGASPEDEPPFPPEPTSQVDVSFIIPWVEGTSYVALTYNGQLLDTRVVSSNPPEVTITNPTGMEIWLPGSSHTLTWDGSDPDFDSLVYSVFYSTDGGMSWSLLQGELTDPSLELLTDSLAGSSDVRFRVVATDGLLTAFDETDEAISVPNQSPIATILNPKAGAIYLPGSLIVLQGLATDMEDGVLPDEALSWSSDIQGGLGIGSSVPINMLDPGTHLITLTVVDSYGAPATASVTITVGYPIYLPSVVR